MIRKHLKDQHEFSRIKARIWDSADYGSHFTTPLGVLVDRLERTAVSRALAGRHYERCVDVGIGNGRLLNEYGPHVGRTLGLDVSYRQLVQARRKAARLGMPCEVMCQKDASRLAIQDSSFDLVVCTRVLQHLYDRREAVAEFARVLKPGGELLLLTYNRFSLFGLKKLYENRFVNPMKGRFCNPVSLEGLLRKNGFEVTYLAGALIGQPELFGGSEPWLPDGMVRRLERLSHVNPVKYLGGRLVVRAHKVAPGAPDANKEPGADGRAGRAPDRCRGAHSATQGTDGDGRQDAAKTGSHDPVGIELSPGGPGLWMICQ